MPRSAGSPQQAHPSVPARQRAARPAVEDAASALAWASPTERHPEEQRYRGRRRGTRTVPADAADALNFAGRHCDQICDLMPPTAFSTVTDAVRAHQEQIGETWEG